jgi:hypothetical protein
MRIVFVLLSLFLFSLNAETKLQFSTKIISEPSPGSSLRVTSTNGLNVRDRPCDGSMKIFSLKKKEL